MRTIMIMNTKGGCGKTTLATNLACWFADQDGKVALADFDPQASSLDWLEARNDYDGVPEIEGIDATKDAVKPARGTEYLIVDVPAGLHGDAINKVLKKVETLIIPVLPSPIDMRAVKRFLTELLESGRVSKKMTKIALVANRVRENSVAWHTLEDFLVEQKIPVLTHLRDSTNYLKCAETGLSIFELAPSAVAKDMPQWDPIIDWLESRKSMPT
ncbi:MAG: AAA family ATPase [Gammaproteobacteria bacterium]|nr:AAA family ATPase [Gammaproteobacteria bacterium]NNJ90171.1 AAA family ATPase [Gammaproteobacteria bacterium]